MSRRPRALCLLPSEASQGRGHAIRCRRLARFLPSFDVEFLEWNGSSPVPVASLYVLDRRETPSRSVKELRMTAPVVVFDSAGDERGEADYVIETLPTLEDAPGRANLHGPEWLPIARTDVEPARGNDLLVYAGGLASPDARALLAKDVEAFCAKAPPKGGVIWISPGAEGPLPRVPRLEARAPSEDPGSRLFEGVDIVFTYWGLTAFEALALGREIVLVGPSAVHSRLARRHLPSRFFGDIGRADFSDVKSRLDENPPAVPILGSQAHRLDAVFLALLQTPRNVTPCIACDEGRFRVESRRAQGHLETCRSCGLTRLREVVPIDTFAGKTEETYDGAYFNEEYRAQYGRTYMEDRENIYRFCDARLDAIARARGGERGGSILDIGAATGFFLDRAAERGFRTAGVEISAWAAAQADPAHRIFRGDVRSYRPEGDFDVITLWYVIEHFREPLGLLEKLASWQKRGGTLAFSTPHNRGLTGRSSRARFLAESPEDHFFIYARRDLRKIMSRLGYRLVLHRDTGVHPARMRARFPLLGRFCPDSLWRRIAARFHLGDTAEYVWIKERD